MDCGVWPPYASDSELGRFGVLDLAGNFSGWASVPLELPSLADAQAAAVAEREANPQRATGAPERVLARAAGWRRYLAARWVVAAWPLRARGSSAPRSPNPAEHRRRRACCDETRPRARRDARREGFTDAAERAKAR